MSYDLVTRLKDRRYKGQEGMRLEAANRIEADANLIQEMREALKQERVMRMIAEGAGATQAQIYAQVKADQDDIYIRSKAKSQQEGETE